MLLDCAGLWGNCQPEKPSGGERKWKGNLIIHLQRQMLVPTQGPALGRLMWAVTFAQTVFMAGLGNGLLGVPCGTADGPAHSTASWGRLQGTRLLSPGALARAGLRGTALQPGMAVLCWSTGRAVLEQRGQGEFMAPSQQPHLSQVGWGCKPRGEGGKQGKGPCAPLPSQHAQGLCFVLLRVQGQLTAEREGVWLEPGHESWMADLQETP